MLSIFMNFGILYLIIKIVADATVSYATIITDPPTKVKEKSRILLKKSKESNEINKKGAPSF